MGFEEMIFWKRAPFIKILIAFLPGIIIEWYYLLPNLMIVSSIIFLFLIAISLFFLPVDLRFRYQKIHTAIVYLLIFFFGCLLTFWAHPAHQRSWYGNVYKKNDALLIVLHESWVEKENTFKTTAHVKGIIRNQDLIPCQGNVLLYFNKKKCRQLPRFGDLLKIDKGFERITPNGNPGGFDNQKYQAFQKTYFQIFLNDDEFRVIQHNQANDFRSWIYRLQQQTLAVLRKYIKGHQQLGIAEALLIGYKNDLETSLTQSYTNAGVVHVIAISGLHLGLIYMTLWWILGLLPIFNKYVFWRVLITIFSIWIFSFIAGSNSSVLRSAVMFTCILFGKLINRQASIFNALAASAFLLISFDPYLLWDIGFQLSYLAILGIVCLQQRIEHWITGRLKLWKQISAMLATTLAAQIGTLPLCLYYFHQFPNYFVITNMVAVPLSTIILFLEVILLVCSPLNKISILIGSIINWLIGGLNDAMETVNHWPFSITDNIQISSISTILLYCIIFSIALLFVRRKKLFLKWGLVFFLIFVIFKNGKIYFFKRQCKLVVYKLYQQSAIDFIFGDEYICLGEKNLNKKNRNALLQSRKYMNVNPIEKHQKSLGSQNFIIQCGRKKIAIICRSMYQSETKYGLSVDCVILSGSPKLQLAQLKNWLHPALVIVDGSNQFFAIEKWKKEAAASQIPLHIIASEGAFIMNMH